MLLSARTGSLMLGFSWAVVVVTVPGRITVSCPMVLRGSRPLSEVLPARCCGWRGRVWFAAAVCAGKGFSVWGVF